MFQIAYNDRSGVLTYFEFSHTSLGVYVPKSGSGVLKVKRKISISRVKQVVEPIFFLANRFFLLLKNWNRVFWKTEVLNNFLRKQIFQYL